MGLQICRMLVVSCVGCIFVGIWLCSVANRRRCVSCVIRRLVVPSIPQVGVMVVVLVVFDEVWVEFVGLCELGAVSCLCLFLSMIPPLCCL